MITQPDCWRCQPREAQWGSGDGLITHHISLPVSPHSSQILPGLHYSSWHVITWSLWGSHETWDTLSKLFPVHKIYDPKVAPIIYQIVSGSPLPISLWQISWEFLWRNPPPRFFSSCICVSKVLLLFLRLSNQMTTYREQVTRTMWFTWCAHCLTLTNFPEPGLLFTWPALTGQQLAGGACLPVRPPGRGPVLPLRGAPLTSELVTTNSRAEKITTTGSFLFHVCQTFERTFKVFKNILYTVRRTFADTPIPQCSHLKTRHWLRLIGHLEAATNFTAQSYLPSYQWG